MHGFRLSTPHKHVCAIQHAAFIVSEGTIKNNYNEIQLCSKQPPAFQPTAGLGQPLAPATLCDFLPLQGKIYGLWAVYSLSTGLEWTVKKHCLHQLFHWKPLLKRTTRTKRLRIQAWWSRTARSRCSILNNSFTKIVQFGPTATPKFGRSSSVQVCKAKWRYINK